MTETPSIQRLARTAGLLYLVLVIVGMFAPIVLETLVVPGDAAATTENVRGSVGLFGASLVGWVLIVVVDVAMSVVLYLLFEPVDRQLSLVSAAFRLVYSAVLGAFLLSLFDGFTMLTGVGAEVQDAVAAKLTTFQTGFRLALVFFGTHLILLGVLLKRSMYVPLALAILMLVAGTGYIVDAFAGFFFPTEGDLRSTILLTPALFAEVGLTGWLLVKGVRLQAGVATA